MRWLRFLVVLVVAGLSAACERSVAIDYVPPAGVSPVAGAANVAVSVTAADRRTQFTDRIGTRKNAAGTETGKVTATNDVVELVRTALVREFRNQGFAIRTGGTVVHAELQNFYENVTLSPDWISVGEVAFALRVRDASGALLYTGFYSGTSRIEGAQHSSAEDFAKESLQRALTDAMRKVVGDKGLQQALLASARGS